MEVGNVWARLRDKSLISRTVYTGESLSERFMLLAEHRSPMPKQKPSSRKCWLHTCVLGDGCLRFPSFAIEASTLLLTQRIRVQADTGLPCVLRPAPSTGLPYRTSSKTATTCIALSSVVGRTPEAGRPPLLIRIAAQVAF